MEIDGRTGCQVNFGNPLFIYLVREERDGLDEKYIRIEKYSD
jgi:hypothetical protein